MKEGKKAPAFKLPDQDGDTVRLSDFNGRHGGRSTSTPRTTRRAARRKPATSATASEHRPAGRRAGCQPRLAAHQVKFAAKYGLPFTLLADPDHKVADEYGVWVEKSMYGRKYMGIERSTFVIGPDGKCEGVFRKVSTRGARRAGAQRRALARLTTLGGAEPRDVPSRSTTRAPSRRPCCRCSGRRRRRSRRPAGPPRSCAWSRRGTRTASQVFMLDHLVVELHAARCR